MNDATPPSAPAVGAPAPGAEVPYYAPAGKRATWFALRASLMNLALVAGQLFTKYLNEYFVVARGAGWQGAKQ